MKSPKINNQPPTTPFLHHNYFCSFNHLLQRTRLITAQTPSVPARFATLKMASEIIFTSADDVNMTGGEDIAECSASEIADMTEGSAPKITFISADGVNITVDRDIADCSLLIRDMLTDLPGHVNEPILLQGVKDKFILEKVVEWCTYHRSDTRPNETTDNDQDLRPNAGDEDKDRRETIDNDAQETTDNDVQETTDDDVQETTDNDAQETTDNDVQETTDSDYDGYENDSDYDDNENVFGGDEITDHDYKTTDNETPNISEWDETFITALDQETLLGVVLAANFLDIKDLLDIGCIAIGNMIKGKNVEQLRDQFNIVNDFTPEEEEQIRRENAWADQPISK